MQGVTDVVEERGGELVREGHGEATVAETNRLVQVVVSAVGLPARAWSRTPSEREVGQQGVRPLDRVPGEVLGAEDAHVRVLRAERLLAVLAQGAELPDLTAAAADDHEGSIALVLTIALFQKPC